MPASILLPQVEDINFAAYSQSIYIYGTKPDQYTAMFDQGHIGMPLEATSSLTIAQNQKFTIREMSPDWGYAHEATKVSFQKFMRSIFLFFFNLSI